MDGKFGSIEISEERARGTGHPPVIRTMSVAAANGVYPAGLIAGKDADGDLVPYGETDFPVAHAGTGPDAAAAGAAVASANAVVKIVAGGVLGTATYALSEDGGVTYGDTTDTPADGVIAIGGTGVSITLAAGTHVADDLYVVSVRPSVAGVLDEDCDTAAVGAAICIVHGSVRADALKADIAGTEPGADLLAALFAAGIYEE